MHATSHERTAAGRMRALVQTSQAGPADLRLVADRRRPEPTAGEYLIRVGAAGVNFADVLQTRGTYGNGPAAPYVAGFEAAGEIVAAGPGLAGALSPGTHVLGAGAGAFAQYMTLPAAAARPVPEGWSDAAALGLVLNWATAIAALEPLGRVAAGETVLVHAAAGGDGQAAVRIARHLGARVVATASPAKHDLVHGLGADVVLDRDRPDLAAAITEATGGVDVVLDAVGATTLRTSLSVARPFTGRVVVFGAASGDAAVTTHELVFEHPVGVLGLHVGALAERAPAIYAAVLARLDALIAAGVCAPGRPTIHGLADGPAVLAELAAARTVGKHALDPWR